MGKQRAGLVPSRFFYHPCRMVQVTGGEFGREAGEIEYVAYDEVADLILRTFDDPKPLAFMHRDAQGRGTRYTMAVNHWIRELQGAGLLVPVGGDAPIDCGAVFWTARFLFGLMQLDEEFVPALDMVAKLAPKRVVEIGTCHGGSLFSWAMAATADARLVSIDMPGGDGYTPKYAERYSQFCGPEQQLEIWSEVVYGAN